MGQGERRRGFINFQEAGLIACTRVVPEEVVGSDHKLNVF